MASLPLHQPWDVYFSSNIAVCSMLTRTEDLLTLLFVYWRHQSLFFFPPHKPSVSWYSLQTAMQNQDVLCVEQNKTREHWRHRHFLIWDSKFSSASSLIPQLLKPFILSESPAVAAALPTAFRLGGRMQLPVWTVAAITANLNQILCNIYQQMHFLVLLWELRCYAHGKQHSAFSIRSCQLSVQTQALGAGQYMVEETTDVGSQLNNKNCWK